jgi:23S rRNA (uracil1939-C5)-methyltransferase
MGGSRRGIGANRPELRPNSPVELLIERIGAQGDGIAQYRGEPVFVPFTAAGDRVRACLGPRRGAGFEGRIVDQIVCGPDRTDPPCPHFGTCGGCALQHLGPVAYEAVKLGALQIALERVGIDPGVVGPLRVVPPARRRARLGIVRPRDPLALVRVGYRERFRHNLVDLGNCPVLEPALFAVIGKLRPVARDLVSPGGTAEATLTRTDSGIDLLIEAAERPGLDTLEALARFAAECDLARIVWRSPDDEIVVVERRPARMLLSGVAVGFPPGGFVQASQAAEMILVDEVLGGIGTARPALDLFAGLGTFAFALADAGPVHAVEGNARAASALAEAAAAGETSVTVERRDLARYPIPADALSRYAAAVFDPPRAGAARQAEALAVSALARIVAISCNPASFARDAARLIAGGFHLDRVTPVDQFVWTPHLELAAAFRR